MKPQQNQPLHIFVTFLHTKTTPFVEHPIYVLFNTLFKKNNNNISSFTDKGEHVCVFY